MVGGLRKDGPVEPGDPHVLRQRIAALEAQLAVVLRRLTDLEVENVALRAENAALKTKIASLEKNSSNSSKPPSSDIVKPPASSASTGHGKAGGKIGGQPGHPRHEREDLPPEQVDRFERHALTCCPGCGGPVRQTDHVTARLQQMELVEVPVEVREHQAMRAWCPRCRKHHDATLPEPVKKAGLLGVRLTALLGWFKSQGHDSYSVMAEFLRDVAGRSVSRGMLAKAIQKVSAALADPYAALTEALVRQERLNVDETGHSENKQRMWTWVFRAERFTVFHIDSSRGSEVLVKMLGDEFSGTLGCDYFSAYRKYMGSRPQVLTQFCLAHLIRDLKFVTTLPDPAAARWGHHMLAGMRRLFGVIHRRDRMTDAAFDHAMTKARGGRMTDAAFSRAMTRARDALLNRARRGPPRREVQNLIARFAKHGDAYFRFVTTPGVAPTNNLAEQALRCVVIDRRLTQGTRSPRGRQWCQRVWTAAATCRQQTRSFFTYLHDTLHAAFENRPTPALLPTKP